jgi:hypothetical protein
MISRLHRFWVPWLALTWTARLAGAPAPPSPPGIVIDHSPAASQRYIGSPSIARLPDGRYLASHDFFGPGTTYDHTVVFESADRGGSWQRVADIDGQFWSSLFVHRGAAYLMGPNRQNGAVVIRRSADGGRTWTVPQDPATGLLRTNGSFHTAPTPLIVHEGRVWRAMEDTLGPGGWGTSFRSFIMSAPENADLLNAASWTSSVPLGRDPAWLGGKFGGWLEGNAVVDPDGRMTILLRVDYRTPTEKAALIHVAGDGRSGAFDPGRDFVDFPGGCKKFTVRRDPAGPMYWALANHVPEAQRGYNPERTRNTLALLRSSDLRQWEVRTLLLQHPDPVHHGFQYADWEFDGEDLIAVVRVAFDDAGGGAHNQHDANFMTFLRVRGFRTLRGSEVVTEPKP